MVRNYTKTSKKLEHKKQIEILGNIDLFGKDFRIIYK